MIVMSFSNSSGLRSVQSHEARSSTIDFLISKYHLIKIVVPSDFIVHSQDWLDSTKTGSNPPDNFPTTKIKPYQTPVSAHLGRSDYGHITFRVRLNWELFTPQHLAPWICKLEFSSAFLWSSVYFWSSDPSNICFQVSEVNNS